MNWHCYAIYGERLMPLYYVAEQEDVTELETLRQQHRLLLDPLDAGALQFFAISKIRKSPSRKDPSGTMRQRPKNPKPNACAA